MATKTKPKTSSPAKKAAAKKPTAADLKPDKRNKGLNQRHDWFSMRIVYTQGLDKEGGIVWPTLDQVAELFSCPPGQVRDRAALERWTQDREQFQTKVRQASAEEKVETLAKRAAAFDLGTLQIAERGIRMVQEALDEATKNGKNIIRVDTLRELMRTAGEAQKIGRLSLGESTENSRLELPKGEFTVGRRLG